MAALSLDDWALYKKDSRREKVVCIFLVIGSTFKERIKAPQANHPQLEGQAEDEPDVASQRYCPKNGTPTNGRGVVAPVSQCEAVNEKGRPPYHRRASASRHVVRTPSNEKDNRRKKSSVNA